MRCNFRSYGTKDDNLQHTVKTLKIKHKTKS